VTRQDYERAIDQHLPDVLQKLAMRLQNFPVPLMKKMMLERWDQHADKHPVIDFATDPRDWMEEETQELVDGSAYRTFAIMKRLSLASRPSAHSSETPSPSLET
jgi:hypothetical protein